MYIWYYLIKKNFMKDYSIVLILFLIFPLLGFGQCGKFKTIGNLTFYAEKLNCNQMALFFIHQKESCIDNGDLSLIFFEDDTSITLTNQAEFNCKGSAFFYISNEEYLTIFSKKIKVISMGSNYGKIKATVFSNDQNTVFKKYINCVFELPCN